MRRTRRLAYWCAFGSMKIMVSFKQPWRTAYVWKCTMLLHPRVNRTGPEYLSGSSLSEQCMQLIRQMCYVLLTLLAWYAEKGLWNCRASVCLSACLSVCLSVCPSHFRPPYVRRCGGFAAAFCPAARRYRSIAARPALSSKCEQCHVVSWRRQLNTDLLLYHNAETGFG